jgi:hypothetical protein
VSGDRENCNEELRNLYALPNIIRVNKSRTIKCAEHVACIGEMRNLYKITVRITWKSME